MHMRWIMVVSITMHAEPVAETAAVCIFITYKYCCALHTAALPAYRYNTLDKQQFKPVRSKRNRAVG